jgi:hypothetical protein
MHWEAKYAVQTTNYVEMWKLIQKTYFSSSKKFKLLGTSIVHTNVYSHEKVRMQIQTRKMHMKMTNLRCICTRRNSWNLVFYCIYTWNLLFSYDFFKSEFASQLFRASIYLYELQICQVSIFLNDRNICFLNWFPCFHLVWDNICMHCLSP